VALSGRPNVGKSTLLNSLVGQHISIVSPKAQTTRERVAGILSAEGYQIVLVDSPGLIDPGYALQESMRFTAGAVIAEADVLVFVVDATRAETMPDESLALLLRERGIPTLFAINKSDATPVEATRALVAQSERAGYEALAVSALDGTGTKELVGWIVARLPESPPLYPADDCAVQPVRFFAEEFVRESCLDLYHEEVPYSVVCRVEEFREAQDPVYIGVTVYVERESQKGIVIGRGGAAIRRLGQSAREKIENMLGQRVYLELRVKVMPDWRRKRDRLRQMGFPLPPEKGVAERAFGR
jgi:GTP-binding protein Era